MKSLKHLHQAAEKNIRTTTTTTTELTTTTTAAFPLHSLPSYGGV
jgi:hypothetical protein